MIKHLNRIGMLQPRTWRQYQAKLKGLDPRPRKHPYNPHMQGGPCINCGETEWHHHGWTWRALSWLGVVGR